MEIEPKVLQDMTDFIEESTQVLEKHASTETKMASNAPAIADKLIKAGMLPAGDRDVAIMNLQDSVKLQAALEHIANTKIASAEEAGKTAPAKLGNGGSVPSAGQSKTATERNAKSEADRRFEESFGL